MSFVDHPQPIQAQQAQPKKRTRRRLRVSCVECTRRRQKCDRQQPCGLCKTRGVEHLCRWETEPYARPPPARPPGRAATRREKPANVITDWQITTTNSGINSASTTGIAQSSPTSQALLPWRGSISSPSSVSPASSTFRASLSPLEGPNEGLKEAALALARMQLTEEDHRLEGSLAYTLQGLTDNMPLRTFELPLQAFPQSFAMVRSNEPFVPRLPDKAHCMELLTSFNEHVNWCIGIPQNVLFSSHEAMWEQIRVDKTCLQRFDQNWIALLFAIFAFSPACATEEESRNYFNQALAARKLEEDRYSSLDSPTPSNNYRGAVYTCLATAFLARYLQDRGRVTEAWRVVGSGLRDAQSAGLHRILAPGKAKHLTNDERQFMIVAWHLCVEFDRYLSLFLGRPTVVRDRDCNVQLPPISSTNLAPDGSTNTALLFQYYFISMTQIVSEAKEKFLSEIPELEDGHDYFERRLAGLLGSLPPFYNLDQAHAVPNDHLYPKLYLQRMTIYSYYTASRLFFHRALVFRKLPQEYTASPGVRQQLAWDQSQLAQFAINVLHAQVALKLHQWWERQVPFDISMYMFEAAVTLGVTLLRYPYHPSANDWRRELANTIAVFEDLRPRDFGKIVAHAIQVLRVLQDLCNDQNVKQADHSHAGNIDPTVVQEEPKVFFPMDGYDQPSCNNAHLNGNGDGYANVHANVNVDQNLYTPVDNPTDLFGNVWIQQPAPMPDIVDPSASAAAAAAAAGVAGTTAANGAVPDASSGYPYMNDGIDFSAYATWTTDADGFMMPTLGPEANINVQYG